MPASDLFEIPEAFPDLETTIGSIREKMQEEVARDPLPKFDLTSINEITQWLKGANNAIEGFISSFRGENLQSTSDELLNSKLTLARKSSLQLGVLLNDQSEYKSYDLKLLTIKERDQGYATKSEVRSLIFFLETFGKATWLGNLLTAEYQAKQDVALNLLRELLSPSQRKQIPPLAYTRAVSLRSEGLSEQKQSLERAAKQNAEESFRALKNSFSYMLKVVTQEEQRYLDLQAEMNNKMQALKEFAETVQSLPRLLKNYLLIRVGDISAQDMPQVKAWVGKDEIAMVQQLLEEFRDAVIQEKSVREMCARMNRFSPSSRASSYTSVFSAGELGNATSNASTKVI